MAGDCNTLRAKPLVQQLGRRGEGGYIGTWTQWGGGEREEVYWDLDTVGRRGEGGGILGLGHSGEEGRGRRYIGTWTQWGGGEREEVCWDLDTVGRRGEWVGLGGHIGNDSIQWSTVNVFTADQWIQVCNHSYWNTCL